MLGFNIRNDGTARRAEIALATEPALFAAENKGQRTLANFYSSRAAGSLNLAGAETMYIVQPEVLSRFVGKDKLYFALATSGDSGPMKVDVKPGNNSPYVSIKALSNRSMSRVRVLPNRQQRAAGYNGAGMATLEWAGDVATPGMVGTLPPSSPGNAANAANGAGTAGPASHYDDGFGPLPSAPSAAQPSSAQAPSPARPANGAAAQGLEADDDYGIEAPMMVDEDGQILSAQLAYAMAVQPEYSGASRFAASPAFRAVSGARSINRIVIHITDAPTTSSTVNAFTNPAARASSHYLVGQDGEVVQFVHENDVAWHASSANGDTVGIEHVAIKTGGVTYNRRDGTPVHYPAMPPSDAQYCASAALVAYLCDKYNISADRVHILGHAEADPRTTHTSCPNGANWNWAHYMDLVTSRSCHEQPAQPAAAQSWAAGMSTNGGCSNCDQRSAGGYGARAFTDDSDDEHGIDGPMMADEDGNILSAAQAWALSTTPEYSGASRFAAATAFRAMSSPRAINRIIIHVTDAPTTSSTVNFFTNPSTKVSAHYLVGQDGEVVQLVLENNVAKHAHSANTDSIGIEHVAISAGGVTYKKRDGTPVHYPAMPPSDSQYCASAALVSYLCDKYNIPADRVHILGHAEADSVTTHRGCPTAASWDWSHYMGLITSRSCYAQPTETSSGMGRAMAGDDPKQVTGSDGQVQWNLAQQPEIRDASGNTVANATPIVAGTIDLSDWPYLDEANNKRTQLGIKVNWATDNTSGVGAVQITPSTTLKKDGRNLFVIATINALPANGGVASLEVLVRYVFSKAGEQDQVAVTRLVLNGNRRFERNSDWQGAGTPSASTPASAQARGMSAPTARAMVADKWDRIATSVFGAASYDEFLTTLQNVNFMGRSVSNVHADMVSRLQAAETALQALGVTSVPGVSSTLRRRHSMHGMGMAIDFDAMRNPYVLNESGEADLDRDLLGAYDHIADFMLGLSHSSLRNLTRGRSAFGGGSIGEVYDALRAESDGMKEYFLMMNDAERLIAFIGSQWVVVHPGQSAPNLAVIQEQMFNDYEILGGSFDGRAKRPTGKTGVDRPFAPGSSGGRGDPAGGFLSMDKALVVALTDAGLAWGAIDFGGASGDVMHFDCRLTTLGRQAYNALRAG